MHVLSLSRLQHLLSTFSEWWIGNVCMTFQSLPFSSYNLLFQPSAKNGRWFSSSCLRTNQRFGIGMKRHAATMATRTTVHTRIFLEHALDIQGSLVLYTIEAFESASTIHNTRMSTGASTFAYTYACSSLNFIVSFIGAYKKGRPSSLYPPSKQRSALGTWAASHASTQARPSH